MNADIIKANWTQLKGKVRKYWGRITEDEIEKLKGSTQELEGILKKKYAYKEDEMKKEINSFLKENNIKLT